MSALAASSVLLALGLVSPVSSASAQPVGKSANLVCDARGNCESQQQQDGSDGESNQSRPIGNPKDPEGDFKPGPTECKNEHGTKIPCKHDSKGVWSGGDNCYWRLQSPQDPPPAGKVAGEGAWYVCTPADTDCTHLDPVDDQVEYMLCQQRRDFFSPRPEWRNSPPPGVNQLTPDQAAKRFIDTFQLEGVDFTSTVSAKDSGAVNLPVWLWVPEANQKERNWGPYKRSKTLGGVSITAEAKVVNVVYTMGDGGRVTCNGPGVAWEKGSGKTSSPSCGYRYQKMSPGEGSGPYEIGARATWKVSWSGGGQSGVVTTYTESTGPGYVGELHVLNSRD